MVKYILHRPAARAPAHLVLERNDGVHALAALNASPPQHPAMHRKKSVDACGARLRSRGTQALVPLTLNRCRRLQNRPWPMHPPPCLPSLWELQRAVQLPHVSAATCLKRPCAASGSGRRHRAPQNASQHNMHTRQQCRDSQKPSTQTRCAWVRASAAASRHRHRRAVCKILQDLAPEVFRSRQGMMLPPKLLCQVFQVSAGSARAAGLPCSGSTAGPLPPEFRLVCVRLRTTASASLVLPLSTPHRTHTHGGTARVTRGTCLAIPGRMSSIQCMHCAMPCVRAPPDDLQKPTRCRARCSPALAPSR